MRPRVLSLLGAGVKSRALHAMLLFVASLWLLLRGEGDIGYARDEGFYFHASERYAAWLLEFSENRALALSPAHVDAAFSLNSEHPPLLKLSFALSHLVNDRYRIFDHPGTAFRFPAMVLAALLVAVLYLRSSRDHRPLAAWVAAVSLLLLPRIYFHAHLACFDIPMVAMFFFCTLAYERALQTQGPRWPVVTGVLFGLALATKHNSWFLPILFVAHAAVMALVDFRLGQRRAQWRRAGWSLLAMSTLGPLLLYVLWPWLWRHPIDRFADYARFHLQHEYYNIEFLGETYFQPPFPRLYAPLMTLATVPLTFLGLAACGVWRRVGQGIRAVWLARAGAAKRLSSPLLFLFAIGVSYGPWVSNATPIFGGTKHWLTAYPFMALFAGSAAAESLRWLRSRLALRRVFARQTASVAAAGLFLAVPAFQSFDAHPHGLSAYTPIVGGPAGAASLGFNRTFWGVETGAVLDVLNREVPPHGRVYLHDTAYSSWQMLQRDGRLREDIVAVGSVAEADVSLYHHEMHMAGEEYQAWVAFGTTTPLVVRGLDGVPIVWLYRRKR